jgi:adenylate cyclase
MLMGEGLRAIQQTKANPDAFDCCIRGIWYHYQLTREDLLQAEQWFQRAIEIDPKYPRGYMGLARVLFGRCLFGWSNDTFADRAKICLLAERAVALDDRDPYCHYALFAGSLLSAQHQAALAAAQRAIDLNPNFALGHLALGWTRIYLGNFSEALEPLLRAIRLSPNDPLTFLFTSLIALAQYHLGNHEEALYFAERALTSRRNHMVLTVVIACLVVLNQLKEAKSLLAEALANAPADPKGYWQAAHPYADPAHRDQLFASLRKAGIEI